MKFKVSATVPVTQYGNITPELEVEANTYEEAYALAMPKIEAFWNKYVEPGKQLKTAGQKTACFVGGSINYDSVTHTYTNDTGAVYLSGSQYAKQFEKPFDKVAISRAMAQKVGYPDKAAEIMQMWELNATASKHLGTAIHAAMELFGKYKDLADLIKKTSHISNTALLSDPVNTFFKSRNEEKAEYEIFVVDHSAKRAGQVDRLLITGNKTGRVQDFKTNGSVTKSLPSYYHQLSFYAAILEADGWNIAGVDVLHWDGKTWETHSSPVLEMK